MNRVKSLILVLVAAALAALLGAGPAAANPAATSYDVGNAAYLTPGPGGNLWYATVQGRTTGAVGKITPAGDETIVGTFRQRPNGLAAGPDGNLWATSSNSDPEGRSRISRVTPAGVVTTFTEGFSPGARPGDIIAGPDGALWFSERQAKIGRITTDGVVTEFDLPAGLQAAQDLAIGADGRIWFTTARAQRIGAITTSGDVSSYPTGLTRPLGQDAIVLGPDGRIWVAASYIAKQEVIAVAPGGAVEQVEQPFTPGAEIADLAVGDDGNIWATEGNGFLARITPAGAVTEITGGREPGSQARYDSLGSITTAADGNLWFSDGSHVFKIPALLEDATQPNATIDSAPPRVLRTPERRVQLDYTVSGTAGALLGCDFDIGRTPDVTMRSCNGGAYSHNAATSREYDYVYTLTVTAVGTNGVVDSTPAIARTKIIRERGHGG